VGEFDDGALLKSFAGAGFMVSLSVLYDIVLAEHGLAPVGTIDSIVEHFYVVSVERRERHPAVQRILGEVAGVFERN